MKFDNLKKAEQASLTLRSIYESYGYMEYQMSKFEEYSVYADNRDFLAAEKLVTFTAPDGKLMALRPDVTLSIVKNARLISKMREKVFYNENVYRISKDTGEIREINQIGIEQLGDIDIYSKAEIVYLALKSLKTLSSDYMLELSHVGFVDALLDSFENMTDPLKARLTELLYSKNLHDFKALKEEFSITDSDSERFSKLVRISGRADKELIKAKELATSDKARDAIIEIESVLNEVGNAVKYVQLDFSVRCAQSYYNGLVFSGYIQGLPRAVLSGGQYDKLIEKFNKGAGAMGFAVYLGELESFMNSVMATPEVLVLYKGCAKGLLAAADKLREKGTQVLCAQKKPKGVKFSYVYRFENGTITEDKE